MKNKGKFFTRKELCGNFVDCTCNAPGHTVMISSGMHGPPGAQVGKFHFVTTGKQKVHAWNLDMGLL